MDDKLFDVFSEETEVPECVLRRVDETLEMIENSAESDRGYQKEEKTGKVINGTDRMGKIGTRKNWKRSLILTFAAVMVFGATVFAAEKYIGISGFFQEGILHQLHLRILIGVGAGHLLSLLGDILLRIVTWFIHPAVAQGDGEI